MALFPRFGFVSKLFGKAAPACKPADVSDGVGLSNIRERLGVIYGPRGYRFERGRGDEGYEVALRLPLDFIEEEREPAENLRAMPPSPEEEETGDPADDGRRAWLARKAR